VKTLFKLVASFCTISSLFVLSGCSNGSRSDSEASSAPAPTSAPLFIDSSKWKCTDEEDYGACNVATFKGASTPEDERAATDYAMFQFICMSDATASQAFVMAGADLRNPADSRYRWNPNTNPVFEYSIDQGARKTSGYDIEAANGNIIPHGIDLLDEWPSVMRDIAGAKTLQIWISDSTGSPREIAFNVEDSVSAVANLAAWGYNCTF
jgi:hypothetical protein